MIAAKPLPPFCEVDYYLQINSASPSGLIWKNRPKQSKIKMGATAGRRHHAGYWQVKFKGKLYLCHRIVYLLNTGEDPGEFCVDHPFNRSDNINVRKASRKENSFNRKKNTHYKGRPTSSKFKGVCFFKATGKWRALIMKGGKSIFLGSFNNEIDAARAYNKAAIEQHGEFAGLNDVD